MNKALATALFGAAGLLSALVAWLLLGRETAPVVIRAIASAAAAGAVLGSTVPRWMASREPRDVVKTGLVTGLGVHPLTWLLFVLWALLIPSAGPSVGGFFQSLENVFFWTMASIPHGGALTIPMFIGAAWAYGRLSGMPPRPAA